MSLTVVIVKACRKEPTERSWWEGNAFHGERCSYFARYRCPQRVPARKFKNTAVAQPQNQCGRLPPAVPRGMLRRGSLHRAWVRKFPGRSPRTPRTAVLRAETCHRSRIQSRSRRPEAYRGTSRASQGPLRVESVSPRLMPQKQVRTIHVKGRLPGKLTRTQCLRFVIGGWSCRHPCLVCAQFQTPRGKAGVRYTPHCLRSSGTGHHSRPLGRGGKPVDVQIPSLGPRPALPVGAPAGRASGLRGSVCPAEMCSHCSGPYPVPLCAGIPAGSLGRPGVQSSHYSHSHRLLHALCSLILLDVAS